MKGVFDWIDRIISDLCKILLGLQVIIVSWVVFGRFFLKYTPGWGEQSALMAMVWFGLLSASIGIRDNTHLNITIAERFLSAQAVRWIDRINNFLIFLFSVFMVVEGIKLTKLTYFNVITGLGIPSSWLYASIPVAGMTIIFQFIHKARGKK